MCAQDLDLSKNFLKVGWDYYAFKIARSVGRGFPWVPEITITQHKFPPVLNEVLNHTDFSEYD